MSLRLQPTPRLKRPKVLGKLKECAHVFSSLHTGIATVSGAAER